MKKILALMGSPRKGKNTDKLLDYLLEALKGKEYAINKIYIRDKKINPCMGCEYCGEIGVCISNDDMDQIYSEIDNSDIIILAAPIYFNSVNGMTKNMIDRCQKYWSLKYSLNEEYKRGQNRIGIFLSTGGAPFSLDQFTGARHVMEYFFKAINAEYKGNYFVSNTDIEPMENRLDVKDEIQEIGKNILKIKNFYLQR
ncbi:MAG TPA: flavodoxin family protein [Tissierellaceae bacterium]|nr:flavodoxin family protein [Tissierellaceae bacterium]